VLNRLILKFQTKNPQATLETLGSGKRRVKISEEEWVDFLWHNDPALKPENKKDDPLWDSEEHYDIEMTRVRGQAVKKRYIEVKGTARREIHLFLQAMEWQTMLQHRSEYHVYVVTQLGTRGEKFVKFKDFMLALLSDQLKPLSATEFLGAVM